MGAAASGSSGSRNLAGDMVDLSSDARRPGTRLLVEYPSDPGWAHERLVLWPGAVGGSKIVSCIYMTPDGELREEQDSDYSRAASFTTEYPAWVKDLNVRQFDAPMEDKDVKFHIDIARRDVKSVLDGRRGAPDPTEWVDWFGNAYPLARLGVLRRGRDAFVGHASIIEHAVCTQNSCVCLFELAVLS